MNVQIENAINIIDVATEKRVSLTDAALMSGYSKGYVHNVKYIVPTLVDRKSVSKKEASALAKALKDYSKVMA